MLLIFLAIFGGFYTCIFLGGNETQRIGMHLLIASARCFVQAIVALKKGAHLLKCGKRGKPKFCAFRISSVSNLVPAISLQETLEPVFDTGILPCCP